MHGTFEAKGWELLDATIAFEDEVFHAQPDIVPAGESLVWALAKALGAFEASLRYPGEDGVYEEAVMDLLGLWAPSRRPTRPAVCDTNVSLTPDRSSRRNWKKPDVRSTIRKRSVPTKGPVRAIEIQLVEPTV